MKEIGFPVLADILGLRVHNNHPPPVSPPFFSPFTLSAWPSSLSFFLLSAQLKKRVNPPQYFLFVFLSFSSFLTLGLLLSSPALVFVLYCSVGCSPAVVAGFEHCSRDSVSLVTYNTLEMLCTSSEVAVTLKTFSSSSSLIWPTVNLYLRPQDQDKGQKTLSGSSLQNRTDGSALGCGRVWLVPPSELTGGLGVDELEPHRWSWKEMWS